MTSFVSTPVLIGFGINILVSIGLPIGLMIFLLVKRQKIMVPLLTGAAVFVVSQLILRSGMLTLIGLTPMAAWLQKNIWIYAIFLGLTAGLFEEFGRLIGFRCLKTRRSWMDGIAFGIGHGGIESILLVGLSNINGLANSLALNSGVLESISQAAGLPQETIQQLIAQLTSYDLPTVLMGGLERVFTLPVQIALTLLVLFSIRSRKPAWLVLAIGLHLLIDSGVVLLQAEFHWNLFAIEAVIGLFAAAALIFIFRSKKTLFAEKIQGNA